MLATARTINGISFDGSVNITVTAAAGTLTGTTLNSSVVTSSLTSVGTIVTGVWNGTNIAVANGGTGVSTLTAYAPIFGGTTGTGAVQSGTVGTSGQVLTSNGAGALPTFQAATGGGTGLTWSEVTGTTQTASVNNGYVTNNAGLVTVTIPTTASVGDIVRVVGSGAGGWKIAQNASEIIHFGSIDSTTGVGGSLASSVRYDSVEIICIVANTEWAVISSMGNINIV